MGDSDFKLRMMYQRRTLEIENLRRWYIDKNTYTLDDETHDLYEQTIDALDELLETRKDRETPE